MLGSLAGRPPSCHAGPSAAIAPGQIDHWVRQLGERSFSAREKASRLLWSAGEAAEPALRAAVKSADPEVARRAHAILDQFDAGIYPDTPAAVSHLAKEFRSGTPDRQQAAVRELLRSGRPGYRALRKLAGSRRGDGEAPLREWIAEETHQAAEDLASEDRLDEADEVLELGMLGGTDLALRNYAAFQLLRGTLDRKVTAVRRQDAGGDRQAALVLAYLLRSQGDRAGARAAAERAGRPDLVESLLVDAGDWARLARRWAGRRSHAGSQDPAESGLRATVLRLASDPGARAQVDQIAGGSGWPAATALFFSDRPAQGIAALARGGEDAAAFELLCAQTNFREGFALADRLQADTAASSEDLPQLQRAFRVELGRSKAFFELGEKERGLRGLDRLAKEVKQNGNAAQIGALIGVEIELGLEEGAHRLGGEVLDRLEPGQRADPPHWLLAAAFPDNTQEARAWLRFLDQKSAIGGSATRLRRVGEILAGKLPAKELDTLLRDGEQAVDRLADTRRQPFLLALTEAASAGGRPAEAVRLLEKAAAGLAERGHTHYTPLVRLGQLLAEQKRWAEAADAFRRAWECDRKKALALYLHGRALQKAGRIADGSKAVDRARRLPLGDDAARYELAEGLARHGLVAEARGEQELILRTGAFGSVYVTNVLNRLQGDALARKDFATAAAYGERIMVTVEQTGASFVQARACLGVPCGLHLARARAAAAAHRIEEAVREARLSLALLPGEVEVPIAVGADLEKAGRRKEADELFAAVFDRYTELCRIYPRSAWAHNSLAWLAARCRRRLDAGVESARRAVAESPQTPGYWDTLAEVHFQRKEPAEALSAIRRCVGMDPKNDYYRRQVKRMEASDPSVDVPED